MDPAFPSLSLDHRPEQLIIIVNYQKLLTAGIAAFESDSWIVTDLGFVHNEVAMDGFPLLLRNVARSKSIYLDQ